MTQFLRQSTANQIVYLPGIVSSTDGDTPQTGLTILNTDIRVLKNGATADVAKTVDGATHVTLGIYSMTLSTTDVDTLGLVELYTHPTGSLLARLQAMVVEPNAYDALYAALGTGSIETDIVSVNGDTVAPANIALQYNTTGIVGDQFPATQSQLSGIANVGSAVHKPASTYVLTTGPTPTGVVSDTQALDAVYHTHAAITGGFEIYYEFLIGSGTPSSVQMTGFVNGNNDTILVKGFDWVTSTWIQIGTINGTNSTVNQVGAFDMFVNMVGSGVDLGKVRVQFFATSGLTSATLAVDQIFVAFSQGAGAYNGAIHLDTGASNTNTVIGVDGLDTNPVSTMTAVNTLLAALNLHTVNVAPNSTVSLAATQNNQVFEGENWTLALGNQDISGTKFIGAVDVTGISTGTSTAYFNSCFMGTCTIPPTHFTACGLSGILTVGSAGEFIFDRCHSHVAGSTTPVFDTGAAIGNVDVSFAEYANGIEIRNLNAVGTDLFSLSGNGQIIYAASSSGTVNQRGNWKVTNTGGVTILTDDNTINIADILVDTADIQPKLGTPTVDVSADIAALNDVAITDIISDGTALNSTAGTLDRVTLVDTTTLNTDMVGTNGANTVVPDAAGTASTLIGALNDLSAAQVNTEVDTALNTAIPGTPTLGSVNDVLNDQARSAKTIQKGTAAAGTLSTTEMTTDLTVSVADQFNGRIIIFANDTTTAALRGQATDITATTVTGAKLGFTALTTAPVATDTFVVV